MADDHQHQRSEVIPPTKTHTKLQKKRHVQRPQHTQPSSLPLPRPQSALDFNVDAFVSSYHHSNMLEKALVHSKPSHDTLHSNASTLISIPYSRFSNAKLRQEAPNLPSKRYFRIIRHIQLTLFTVYRRLFTLVVLANLVPLLLLLRKRSIYTINIDTLSTAASTNFLVAIVMRQDFLINAIFRTAWLVPWSVPLRIRRWVARCYCYGGIHSGAAIAGTLWWIAFSMLHMIRFVRDKSYTLPIVITAYLILALLMIILLLAYPTLRSRYHNTFELTHRLLGWISVLLFWLQLLFLTSHTTSSTLSLPNFATLLIHTPTFWNLTLITALIIYPWLRLRSWTFTPEVLSTHALRLHFNKRVHKFSCLSVSTSPLREWHPFATFPSTDPYTPHSNSLIISAAGDWTRNIIQRAHAMHSQKAAYQSSGIETPATIRLYTRSHPKAGVLSLTCIFPRVLLITTGSGIGPCLSSLLERPAMQHARLIWSTRSPLATYGKEILDMVYKADPEAVIIDTDAVGRPDLVEVGWRVYKEMGDGQGAEAVFVMGNEGVTRKVVYGLESRGIPAFGPIWDS